MHCGDGSVNSSCDATRRGRLIPTTSCDRYFAELALWIRVPSSSLPLHPKPTGPPRIHFPLSPEPSGLPRDHFSPRPQHAGAPRKHFPLRQNPTGPPRVPLRHLPKPPEPPRASFSPFPNPPGQPRRLFQTGKARRINGLWGIPSREGFTHSCDDRCRRPHPSLAEKSTRRHTR